MISNTYSASRKRGKLAALISAAAVVLGVVLAGFVAGALIGIDPGTAVRVIVVLSMPLVLVLVWTAPKSAADPSGRLNQLLACLVLVAVFWPPYIIFTAGGLPSMEPKRFVLLVLLVFWLYKMFTSPLLSQRFFSRWRNGGLPLYVMVGFVCWRLLSALTGEQPVFSVIQFGWNFINYYLVFFVAISCLRDSEDVAWLVKIMAVSAVTVALVGMIERLVGHNLFANMVSVNTEMLQAAVEEKIRDGGSRVQGTFEHPMTLAEYLVLSAPMLLLILQNSSRQWHRVCAVVGLLIVMGGIFLSGTRSAMLTGVSVLGLALVFYFLDNMRRRGFSLKTFASLIGLIGLVIGTLAAIPIAAELIQGRSVVERTSSGARVLQYQQSLPKIEKEPLLGYGVAMGNSQVGFKASRGRYSIDSYYLSMALDSGVPGALLFVGIFIVFGVMGVRLALSQSDPKLRLLARTLVVALGGVMVIRAVLSIENNLVFVSLICAMLLVLKQQARQTQQVPA